MDYKIAIDAGHGGSDSGNTGNGLVEKDYALLISNYIKERLDSLGIENIVTRNTDRTLSADERVNIIESSFGLDDNVIVVSNHLNKGGGSGHVADNVTAPIDYLPLLGEMEIFGTGSGYNNNCEDTYQKQYDYYAAGNSTVKYKYDSNGVGSSVCWWERSANYNTGTGFCAVYTSGGAGSISARYAFGLAPAFKV